MKTPLLSMIVPMFNCAEFIGDAIQSIVQQNISNIEIICIDDASTDSTPEVVKGLNIPLIKLLCRDQNGGIGAARNTGVHHANGEWLAFLDADDLWLAEVMPRFLDALIASKRPWGFGGVEHFAHTEVIKRQVVIPSVTKGFFAGNMLIPRESFLKVGWFDESLRVGEFIDWFSRAKNVLGEPLRFDEIVLRRRIHSSNTSRLAANPEARMGYLRAIAHAVREKQK